MKWRFDPRPRFTEVIVLAFICLTIPGGLRGQPGEPAAGLVKRFKTNPVFWQQFEIAEKIVKLHDTSVLEQLKPYLKDNDRHVRGNAAYIFARLGDDAGFEVIKSILSDRSQRPEGQGIPGGNWDLGAQISADRYYAVHLFGSLKDVRAVAILVPLVHDPEVQYIVPWSLGEIGAKSAVPPIMLLLTDQNPDLRVLAIEALATLRAKEALPRLRLLLHDDERIHFDGLGTVAEAAQAAIAKLEAMP
jgi:HEAT repeat protein